MITYDTLYSKGSAQQIISLAYQNTDIWLWTKAFNPNDYQYYLFEFSTSAATATVDGNYMRIPVLYGQPGLIVSDMNRHANATTSIGYASLAIDWSSVPQTAADLNNNAKKYVKIKMMSSSTYDTGVSFGYSGISKWPYATAQLMLKTIIGVKST